MRPGAGADGEDADKTSRRAPEVFFPRTRKVLDSGPTAMMGGKLLLDEEGCLKVQPGDWVPVWPADLRLETGGDRVRIVGPQGRIVAEVGKKVYMGGGR